MDNYEVIGVIGKGSFGSVTKVKRKTDGKFFVWKEISYGRMSEKEKQQLVSEVNILRELRHPNIVKYYDRIVDHDISKIFIIMEFCEGGDLAHLIRKCRNESQPLPELKLWEIFSQVAQALHECHRRGRKVLHRDIKPGNIFLDANLNVKLGDFGLSRIMSAESMYAYSHVGTPFYMSPEQTREERYNEKSDIWSLGCLLYEMAALVPPFEAKTQIELTEKIRTGKMGRLPERYSPELHRVILWMLTGDQVRRPNIDDILNVPQITMRLKDRKLREAQAGLKRKDAELKAKEEEVKRLEADLQRREAALTERASKLADLEKTLAQRAVQERTIGTPPAHEKQPSSVKDTPPRPVSYVDIRKVLPRGRNLSPYDCVPTARRDPGDRRSYSPKTGFETVRPSTAIPRPTMAVNVQQIDKFIQDYRMRPKTAALPRTPRRYSPNQFC